MSGLPGTEAKQDIKNAGNGCGTAIITLIAVAGLLMAIIEKPLELFKTVGGGFLMVIGTILGWGLLAWILSLFLKK